MAFDAETRLYLPAWRKRKDAQWERIQALGAAMELRGLQLVKSGEDQHQYMLRCARDASEEEPQGFEEGIVIGQLPQVVMEAVGPRNRIAGKVVRRPAPEHKKPVRKRVIDLSDEEVGEILERWVQGKSARDLPFVVR